MCAGTWNKVEHPLVRQDAPLVLGDHEDGVQGRVPPWASSRAVLALSSSSPRFRSLRSWTKPKRDGRPGLRVVVEDDRHDAIKEGAVPALEVDLLDDPRSCMLPEAAHEVDPVGRRLVHRVADALEAHFLRHGLRVRIAEHGGQGWIRLQQDAFRGGPEDADGRALEERPELALAFPARPPPIGASP